MTKSIRPVGKQWVWRRVVHSELVGNKFTRPGEGTLLLTLDCGHVERQQASYGLPDRKRCSQCLALGNVAGQYNRYPATDAEFLTLHALATRWGWHKESIRRLVRQGRIEAERREGLLQIPMAAVERWEADQSPRRAAKRVGSVRASID